MSNDPREVDCQDFVELITEYLEDALPAPERSRIEDHLRDCPGCAAALAQWREVVRLAGAITEHEVDRLDQPTRDELLQVFRESRSPRGD